MFCLVFLIFIGVQLIYNVLLVSGVQQNDSVKHIHISTLFQILFPYRCFVLSCSIVSDSLQPHGLQPTRLLCPWVFSRQEYWSGLPCPPPGDLPNPGIKPRSPALKADSSPSESPGKPFHIGNYIVLSRVPCAFQQILIGYLFYIQASQVALVVKNPPCECRRHKRCGFNPWIRKIPQKREWQPTLVFLPGKSHRQRSLVGCSPQGPTESDATEATWHTPHIYV